MTRLKVGDRVTRADHREVGVVDRIVFLRHPGARYRVNWPTGGNEGVLFQESELTVV